MSEIELREKYGMTPREFADRYLGDYKIRRSEIVPKSCPFCKGGQHNDKNTFAMSVSEGTYNCKRGSCGVSGSFYNLLGLEI